MPLCLALLAATVARSWLVHAHPEPVLERRRKLGCQLSGMLLPGWNGKGSLVGARAREEMAEALQQDVQALGPQPLLVLGETGHGDAEHPPQLEGSEQRGAGKRGQQGVGWRHRQRT